MKKTILLLFILLFPKFISASDLGGPPNKSELLGYWKMIEFPYPKKNKVNPWPLPYQWFAFYDDGSFYSVMSSKDENLSSKELKASFSVFTKEMSPQYKLTGQFIIIQYPDIKNYEQLWGINIFRKDLNETIKKGDMIMSLADSKDGKPIYYRLLRKIK